MKLTQKQKYMAAGVLFAVLFLLRLRLLFPRFRGMLSLAAGRTTGVNLVWFACAGIPLIVLMVDAFRQRTNTKTSLLFTVLFAAGTLLPYLMNLRYFRYMGGQQIFRSVFGSLLAVAAFCFALYELMGARAAVPRGMTKFVSSDPANPSGPANPAGASDPAESAEDPLPEISDAGLKSQLEYYRRLRTQGALTDAELKTLQTRTVLRETLGSDYDTMSDGQRAAEAERLQQEREARAQQAREVKEAADRQRQVTADKTKKGLKIAFPILAAAVVLLLVVFRVIIPGSRYREAMRLMEEESFALAVPILRDLGDYKDAPTQLEEARRGTRYMAGLRHLEAGEYDEAADEFTELIENMGGYRDSEEQLTKANQGIDYETAERLLQNESYERAMAAFEALGDYGDSSERYREAKYGFAGELLSDAYYAAARKRYEELGDYEDSETQIRECDYQIALTLLDEEKKLKTWSGDETVEEEEGDDDPVAVRYREMDEAHELLSGLEGYKDADRILKRFSRKIKTIAPVTGSNRSALKATEGALSPSASEPVLREYNADGTIASDEYGYVYTYTTTGRLSAREFTYADSRGRQRKATMDYTYGSGGRITRAGSTGSFTYDENSRLISRRNSSAEFTYTYDAQGRLTEIMEDAIAETAADVRYTIRYNADGEPSGLDVTITQNETETTFHQDYEYAWVYAPDENTASSQDLLMPLILQK